MEVSDPAAVHWVLLPRGSWVIWHARPPAPLPGGIFSMSEPCSSLHRGNHRSDCTGGLVCHPQQLPTWPAADMRIPAAGWDLVLPLGGCHTCHAFKSLFGSPAQPVLPCQSVRFAAGRQAPCFLLEKQPKSDLVLWRDHSFLPGRSCDVTCMLLMKCSGACRRGATAPCRQFGWS